MPLILSGSLEKLSRPIWAPGSYEKILFLDTQCSEVLLESLSNSSIVKVSVIADKLTIKCIIVAALKFTLLKL